MCSFLFKSPTSRSHRSAHIKDRDLVDSRTRILIKTRCTDSAHGKIWVGAPWGALTDNFLDAVYIIDVRSEFRGQERKQVVGRAKGIKSWN